MQNVCRYFVAWKMQGFDLSPALEKLHALLRVSHGVLGHEATTHVLNVIVLLVSMMLSLPLPDGEHLEAFAMIVGTKPG